MGVANYAVKSPVAIRATISSYLNYSRMVGYLDCC